MNKTTVAAALVVAAWCSTASAQELNPSDPSILNLLLGETEEQRDAALLDAAQLRVKVKVLTKWLQKREADWGAYAKPLYAPPSKDDSGSK